MRLLPRIKAPKAPKVDQIILILGMGLAAVVVVKIINGHHPTIFGIRLPTLPLLHGFGKQLAAAIHPLSVPHTHH